MEQLAAFAEDPPAKARLMPLSVAGAFHTEHMQPAVGHLAGRARSVSTHDPRTSVISNRDGRVVHDGKDMLARIVGQIASPVRWDLCMETMSDLGVTGLLEMPPAGTLTGIAKRALKGVETFALKTPDQLDDARAFIAKHGEASMIETSPTWRMVVSPGKGTFHRAESAAGAETLEAGATIGEVVASVARVTAIMAEITAASREQSIGIDQVNEAILQMDQTTQQNAALVEEAAAAAASMQDQSARLEQLVSHFRLATAQPAQHPGTRLAPRGRQALAHASIAAA
jgi:acyl transferase domain-containing protein